MPPSTAAGKAGNSDEKIVFSSHQNCFFTTDQNPIEGESERSSTSLHGNDNLECKVQDFPDRLHKMLNALGRNDTRYSVGNMSSTPRDTFSQDQDRYQLGGTPLISSPQIRSPRERLVTRARRTRRRTGSRKSRCPRRPDRYFAIWNASWLYRDRWRNVEHTWLAIKTQRFVKVSVSYHKDKRQRSPAFHGWTARRFRARDFVLVCIDVRG